LPGSVGNVFVAETKMPSEDRERKGGTGKGSKTVSVAAAAG